MPIHNPCMKKATFGLWLKTERLRRHMTQTQMEAQAHLSEKYVSRIERLATLPDEELRARIHVVFGTSDEDLVREGVLSKMEGVDGQPVYLRPDRAIAMPETALDQLRAMLKSGEIDEAEAEQIVERRRERRTWKEELGDE